VGQRGQKEEGGGWRRKRKKTMVVGKEMLAWL
jgi:hypothetical protein